MSKEALPVYRIFISSTAIDLTDHRKKASDALVSLGDLPVGMETFGALPSEPVDVCQEKARACDALVVMAYRYGWVPTPEEGGDGHKSITWLEVEAAHAAGKPVFAFLVDEKHSWSKPTEQDQLKQAKDEAEALKVFKKVQALKDFRTFLEREAGLVRETFTNPDNLATKVTASIANWAREPDRASKPPPRPRSWIFRVIHPLQPAPHFRGRQVLLADLHRWWEDPVHPDRVRSLVAIGGAGKTAIAERFLHSIRKERQRGSVLVWSFYEDPNTDAFLREACVVFIGEEGEGAGGRLERLQRALSGGEPHLLVLDGLERVQSEGTAGRTRGDLEDHQLKNLLRSVASGLGRTRALVTSRFKLTDLSPWEGAGHRTHKLDTLDKESARGVLRAWKVKGEDEQLDALTGSVGLHALSVSVLGSYLHHFCNGEPEGAADLELEDLSVDDTQAAKLGRILAGYARDLPDGERDLLIRLSVFPRGVAVEILGYLVDAGGEIAGTLVGANQAKLTMLAERLRNRGLVFAYHRGDSVTYTAHPFLREYFRPLLGIPPEQIHETVRSRLAPGLETRPDSKPRETEMLDRYEALIEHSILAGHVEEAFDLFWYGLGEYRHLGQSLGEYARGSRITARFAEDGEPENAALPLTNRNRSHLITSWGLFAMELGDLALAERCHNVSIQLDREGNDLSGLSQDLQNKADLAQYRGEFPFARELATKSLDQPEAVLSKYTRWGSNSFLAAAHHVLGSIAEARHYFAKAREVYNRHLNSTPGIYEAEHLLDLGEFEVARKLTLSNLDVSRRNEWRRTEALCHSLLGLLSLPRDLVEARTHLQAVREWTAQSGQMESTLRGYLLAAEIAHVAGDPLGAIAEATTGLTLAESCGFGKYAINLLLVLARVHLAIPEPRAALGRAREALDRSQHTRCQYAWGEANALHLCGLCHEALGERELAQRRLEAAIAVRERIEHPGVSESREALRRLKG